MENKLESEDEQVERTPELTFCQQALAKADLTIYQRDAEIATLTAERDRAVEALAQLVPLAEALRNRINFGPNRKANVVAIIPLIDAALTNSRAILAASLQPASPTLTEDKTA